MQTDALPKHSPLGASGAERFMECPGSVGLSTGLENDEDDTFSRPGTVAHALAAHCLRTGDEPWSKIGCTADDNDELHEFVRDTDGVHVDKEMADAIQRYIDDIDFNHPKAYRNQGNTWIERRFHCPSIHPLFYGTSDFVHIDDDGTVHVWDLKYGAGILVEPEDNAQLMYYAAGVLDELDIWGLDHVSGWERKVVLHIHQPRIEWHADGVHRIWETSVGDIVEWLDNTLLPAMERALTSDVVKAGKKHCRFCPVLGYKCPEMLRIEKELATMIAAKPAEKYTPQEAGRFRELMGIAKLQDKAVNKVIFGYLSAGKDVPGTKLSKAKSDREWREGAEEAIKKKLGKSAYTEPSLKSPAQIEKLAGGEALATTWAFKPDRGMTVADATDHRPAVKAQTGKNLFSPISK